MPAQIEHRTDRRQLGEDQREVALLLVGVVDLPEAREMLAFASLLMRRLDHGEAELNTQAAAKP